MITFKYLNIYPFVGFFFIMIILLFCASTIIIVASTWNILKKANKPGYYAIIPIYNIWSLVLISGLNWYYILMIFGNVLLPILSFGILTRVSSLVTLFGLFSLHYNLAKKFSLDEILYGFGLTLLPVVFYPLLAFSKTTYNENIKVSPYGPIEEK